MLLEVDIIIFLAMTILNTYRAVLDNKIEYLIVEQYIPLPLPYTGGGPIDAAKAAAAVLAEAKTNSVFDYTSDCADFIANSQQKFGVDGVNEEFEAAVPLLCALPTTAGTGSEGGQNVVISDADGIKVMYYNNTLP